MIAVWLFMMAGLAVTGVKDFEACKAEDFKPKICARYAPKPPPAPTSQE